jgi:glycosyltransferase involved in cell wall biosynthesis
LVLVGDGDDRPRLEGLARAMGAGDRVRFVGAAPHEAVGDYLQAADLFLFSSTSETQGIGALEALAAGLPVVAVRSDAAVDLLEDGQGGIITEEDPVAFAAGLVELWRQPERRQAMSLAARRVAARYDPGVCAARLLGLYEELIRALRLERVGARPIRPKEA